MRRFTALLLAALMLLSLAACLSGLIPAGGRGCLLRGCARCGGACGRTGAGKLERSPGDLHPAVAVKAIEALVKACAVKHQDAAVVVFADDGL